MSATNTLRYRMGTVAWADDEDTGELYVAALPEGPITQITGVGPALLSLIDEAPEGLTEAELFEQMRGLFTDIPEGAEVIVREFLAEMVSHAVLTTEGSA